MTPWRFVPFATGVRPGIDWRRHGSIEIRRQTGPHIGPTHESGDLCALLPDVFLPAEIVGDVCTIPFRYPEYERSRQTPTAAGPLPWTHARSTRRDFPSQPFWFVVSVKRSRVPYKSDFGKWQAKDEEHEHTSSNIKNSNRKWI